MNRLFVRTLFAILAALLILIVLLSALAVYGVRRSIAEWDTTRGRQLEAAALEALRTHSAEITVPENLPLYVYDPSGALVFTNRPGGTRQNAKGQMTPVRFDGQLLGYYQSGQMRFLNDRANARFLESLERSLLLGLLLSIVIAVAAAVLFSHGLSAPAVRLAGALDRMSRGDLDSEIEERGTREITLIGSSADRLRLQLLREQELRRQWVHDVAHDLRTPVAALQAQLEAMHDGALETSTERIERVLREVARVQQLVGDLEQLMRLESPEMSLVTAPIDLATLVNEAIERFESALLTKEIRTEVDIASKAIEADPGLMQRALGNVVSNAVRHCARGGVVSISTVSRKEAISISVRNTGDPVPEADLERVFDRLFRGEYARGSEGSGLGLTITRNIVALHGGTVEMRNRADGVEVELVLPQPPEMRPDNQTGSEPVNGKGGLK